MIVKGYQHNISTSSMLIEAKHTKQIISSCQGETTENISVKVKAHPLQFQALRHFHSPFTSRSGSSLLD